MWQATQVTKPPADRATRPTTTEPRIRQFASSRTRFPGSKTRQHGGGRRIQRAVTGDEAVDMLSLLLSSDRGNTSSASDGRSALASASRPPRFSTARRTPDHWHVDECCTGTGCLRGLICPGTIGFQARETVAPGRFGRHRCLEREPARDQSPFDHPHEFAFYCLCPLAGTGGYPMWFAFKKALSR